MVLHQSDEGPSARRPSRVAGSYKSQALPKKVHWDWSRHGRFYAALMDEQATGPDKLIKGAGRRELKRTHLQ